MPNEIDLLIQKHGPRVQQPQPEIDIRQPEQMGVAEDMGRSFVSGAYDGATGIPGTWGDIGRAAEGAVSGWYDFLGVDPETSDNLARGMIGMTPFLNMPTNETWQGIKPEMMDHDPQTWQGDIAERVGIMTPGLLLAPGGGSMMTKGLSTLGAAVGGYGGRKGAEWLDERFDIDPKWRPYIEGGADIAGSVAGSMAPEMIKKAISPNALDHRDPKVRQRLRLAEELEKEDVPMTAGQKTGNDDLHYLEKNRTPRQYNKVREAQKEAFSDGALKKGGIPKVGDELADSFNRRHSNLGPKFDKMQTVDVVPNGKMAQEMVDLRDKYIANTNAASEVRGVSKHIQSFLDMFKTHPNGIPGEKVKTIMTDVREMHRMAAARGDSTTANTLQRLINIVDDAVEDSMPPAMKGEYAKLRKEYAQLMLVEGAAGRAGNDPVSGAITPNNLWNETRQKVGKHGVARGRGSFLRYSRAGKAFLNEPRNPGTADTFLAKVPLMKDFVTKPTALGAAIGTYISPGVGTAIGGAIGAGASHVLDRLRMSPAGQAYLANQLAHGMDLGSAGMRAGQAGLSAWRKMANEENQ